ncbi:MAG: terminase, partial [Dehalococcoidia bacterium]|nr:terminase [Dehalococcoidia bacterium]
MRRSWRVIGRGCWRKRWARQRRATSMSDNKKPVVNALLYEDFSSFLIKAFETVNPGQNFVPNWHIDLMSTRLTEVAQGGIQRLVLCLCPRSLKSFVTSVAFPAWCIGRDPSKRFICISYSEDLAAKHSRDSQQIIASNWYRKAFPKARFDGKKFTEHEMETTMNGGRLATSVGGTLTGRGGHVIIIDDPIKADAAMSEAERNRVNSWFTSTVSSRFDDPAKGALVIVSQRTHVDDLVGHVLQRGDWLNVSIPAIAVEDEEIRIDADTVIYRKQGESMHPARLPIGHLEHQRNNIGTYNFEAQYQQKPVPREGNLVKAEWFRTYEEAPHEVEREYVIQCWDTASSIDGDASYSVCTTWGLREHRYYLLDVYRERLLFPALLKKVGA